MENNLSTPSTLSSTFSSLVQSLGFQKPQATVLAAYLKPTYKAPMYTTGLWRMIGWGPQADEVVLDKTKFDKEQLLLKRAHKAESIRLKNAYKKELATYTEAVEKLENIDKSLKALLEEYNESGNFVQANLVSNTLEHCHNEVRSISTLSELSVFFDKYEWVATVNMSNFGLNNASFEQKTHEEKTHSDQIGLEEAQDCNLSLSLSLGVDPLDLPNLSLEDEPTPEKVCDTNKAANEEAITDIGSPLPAILHLGRRDSLAESLQCPKVKAKPVLLPQRKLDNTKHKVR